MMYWQVLKKIKKDSIKYENYCKTKIISTLNSHLFPPWWELIFCFWHLNPVLIGGYYIPKKPLENQNQNQTNQPKPTNKQKTPPKIYKALFLKLSIWL